MPDTRKWAIAGIATVAAVGVVAATASAATAAGSEATTTYCAHMPDTVGLYTGNPVTQMGYRIGTVESIVEQGDHVEVTFTADSDRRLPATVQAVTRSKSLLADRSLELVGNYTDGPALEPGTCIGADNSFTPKTISEIVGSAADFLSALSPEGSESTVADALAGLDAALAGQGGNAHEMMQHASAAMQDPDKFVADIGTAIAAMAPLSEQSLTDWNAIRSIAEQIPDIAVAGTDLFPGTIDVCVGIGWLVATLYDIQTTYGGEIWPFVHGSVTDAIAMAAGRSTDVAGLVGVVPQLSGVLDEQSTAGGLTIRYTPPGGDARTADPASLLGAALTNGAGE